MILDMFDLQMGLLVNLACRTQKFSSLCNVLQGYNTPRIIQTSSKFFFYQAYFFLTVFLLTHFLLLWYFTRFPQNLESWKKLEFRTKITKKPRVLNNFYMSSSKISILQKKSFKYIIVFIINNFFLKTFIVAIR